MPLRYLKQELVTAPSSSTSPEVNTAGLTKDLDFPRSFQIQRNGRMGWLHVPESYNNDNNATRSYPLLVALMGAGKGKYWQVEEQVTTFVEVADQFQVLVFFPVSEGSTWDFIRTRGSSTSQDAKSIEYGINTVRQHWRVDDQRIALKGISDGGSMALSLGTSNPQIFQAVLSVSAGFCVLDDGKDDEDASTTMAPIHKRPQIFLEHGENDSMFPVDRIGRRLAKKLTKAGFDVDFRILPGQGHVPETWKTSFVQQWLGM